MVIIYFKVSPMYQLKPSTSHTDEACIISDILHPNIILL